MPGRVGDSPIIGAGGFADNELGAVSTTGHGEAIMKLCLAKSILDNINKGRLVNISFSVLKSHTIYLDFDWYLRNSE